MPTDPRFILFVVLILAARITSAASADATTEPPLTFSTPTVAGELDAPPRNEASGLAFSRRSSDLLWTHDDSGGATALYAVTTRGELRATLRINGVKSGDWEDIASTELDGKAWLVIGDIGDNDGKRKRLTLYFVEEPSASALAKTGALMATPAASIRITFEDGARDCESLAIDSSERAVYLLSKRDLVPRLYRAELPPGPLKDAAVTADYVGLAPEVARPITAEAFFTGLIEKGRARPCGMDFAADRSAAVVVTYSEVIVYPRFPDDTWADAFSRAPIRLGTHGLPQAEAVCFSADGRSIYVASEETRKLLRYDRR